MEQIKEITKKYIDVSTETLCRCSALHHYCLNCSSCRADAQAQTGGTYLARLIDHTSLKADVKEKDIRTLCIEAVKHNFFSVCVNPQFIDLCADILNHSSVKVCSVISFPLGADTVQAKVAAAGICIGNGADELDMVINISYLKDRKIQLLINEIEQVHRVCSERSVLLKCIIETCLLTDEEKIIASLAVKKGGADFVKTSTGLSTGGALPDDVKLLRQTVGNKMGVKASGGISTKEKADAMINAGANRIGASKSVQIVAGK